MKIAVLTHNITPFSQQRFNEAGRARGHEMRFIHLSYCYTTISANPPQVYYRNHEPFEELDAVIPRFGAHHSFYGTMILRQLERLGIYALNSSLAISWSHDKLRSFQQLAKKQLPMPITGSADAPEESEKLIELVGGAPLIVRLLDSMRGKSTVLAETHQAAVSVINAFKQLKANILVQEYIKESAGSDIRCVVVGNRVITAIQRGIDHRFHKRRRHLLTHHQPIKLAPAEKKLAVQAAKALNLHMATVDLIRSEKGPLVLDLDASPNIELLEKRTGLDIAAEILKFIEEHAARPPTDLLK